MCYNWPGGLTLLLEYLLFTAAAQAHPASVKYLVEDRGMPVDTCNERNETALWVACKSGNLPVVRYLLRLTGDSTLFSSENKAYSSPLLFAAALNRHEEVVGYLLRQGVRPDFGNNLGFTCLKQMMLGDRELADIALLIWNHVAVESVLNAATRVQDQDLQLAMLDSLILFFIATGDVPRSVQIYRICASRHLSTYILDPRQVSMMYGQVEVSQVILGEYRTSVIAQTRLPLADLASQALFGRGSHVLALVAIADHIGENLASQAAGSERLFVAGNMSLFKGLTALGALSHLSVSHQLDIFRSQLQQRRYLEIARPLSGPSMNYPNPALSTQIAEDWDLVLEAAIDGDSQVVETLLNGCNLSFSSFPKLQTVLYFAAIHKQAAVIEYLLASGLNPNGSYGSQRRRSLLNSVLGKSPLSRHQFSKECHTLECVRALLKHGASLEQVDFSGLTALAYAITEDAPQPVIRELLAHGANPLAPMELELFSKTPLSCAYHLRAMEIFEICLRAIEDQRIRWDNTLWNMLRNTVEGPEKSIMVFHFPRTDVEPGCEYARDDSLWAKALTDYYWRTKPSMP